MNTMADDPAWAVPMTRCVPRHTVIFAAVAF
jgi:hypothetical protein